MILLKTMALIVVIAASILYFGGAHAGDKEWFESKRAGPEAWLKSKQGSTNVVPSDVGAIQIVTSSHKNIGHIMRNRWITAIQYTVQLDGYRLECVSVVSEQSDGTNVRALHNNCVSFVDTGR